ncbi:MAG TPA: transcription antitermination factor NusB [Dermatophilaceae bacterium]|nr:transcription antitermination factor NusB [Dermatophilaceae bacterium]
MTGARGVLGPSRVPGREDVARAVAFDTLRAVADGAYANLDLPSRLRRAGVHGRDAGFATELVYGTIRMQGFYDAVLAECAGRGVAAIDPEVLDLLRLGAHQLMGMRVPAHAAVDQSVGLTRRRCGAGAAGFVNAVLRRVSSHDATGWRQRVVPAGDRDDALSVRYSHPEWIVAALRAALIGHGLSTPETVAADLVALLHTDNTPAPVHLVLRAGVTTMEDLIREGATPSPISPVGAVLTGGGDPARIRAVREARIGVQDAGSQLVALAVAGAPVVDGPALLPDRAAAGEDNGLGAPGREQAWLDLCAGPGGKTALLAGLAMQRGVTVYANDLNQRRADLVTSAVRALVRAGARVMIGAGDGRQVGTEEPGRYDRVLLDAPCTGLGALRRRPEARWRRRPEDVAALTALQSQLLASAIAATRPGGLIGYVTCSPHLAETREVVAGALRDHPQVHAVDAQPLLNDAASGPIGDLGDPPYAQLWPHRHGTDAMFLALLRVTRSGGPSGSGAG